MKTVILISFQNKVLAVYSSLKVASEANGWEINTFYNYTFPFIFKGMLFEKKQLYKAKDNHKIEITFEMKEAARLEQEQKQEISNLKRMNTILLKELEK